MPEAFSQLLRRVRDSEDHTAHVDEDWSQGRSAFGGLSAAFAVTGMNRLLDPPLPLRALMVSFIAPLPPGEIEVRARQQRQGKNVTQMGAELHSEGRLCLQTMAAYGQSRPGLKVPPLDRITPLPREQGLDFSAHAKRLPSFLAAFDGCWTGGGLPFSGNGKRELKLWARHREPLPEFPAEKIVALADIPPPVILSHYDKPPVPASSLTWSLEFVTPPNEVDSDWFYMEFATEAAADGYTQQSGRIYTEAGNLCALTRQCMVYFEPGN